MTEHGISSLVFDDSLELCDPAGLISPTDYWYETLADGAANGDPQPVEVTLNSLMRDGAIVATTGDENREASFQVRVCGIDSASLDAGIQALQLATRKRTTLVWSPPDGYCEPRVWDVETSNLLEPNGFDDKAYMLRNQQVFRLRLVCQPYRRSAVEVVDDAGTPPSGGGTLLNNCESTSGWSSVGSGDAGPDITVDTVIFCEGAGSLKARFRGSSWDQGYDTHYASGTSTDQVTGLSLSTASGGYLSVAVRLQYEDTLSGGTTPGLLAAAMQIGGVWVDAPTPVAVKRDASGFIHYVWPIDASLTITGLRFNTYQSKAAQFVDRPYTWYDDIELLPSATTDHQIVKQHFVQGSARTAATIQISSPTESVALGKVLTVTMPTAAMPAGFQPDGLRWIANGTPTADATALGGNYYTPNSTYTAGGTYPVFDVPVSMLTAGAYIMVALVKVESMPLVAGVQAQLLVAGTAVGPLSSAEVSNPDIATGWQFVPLGTVNLPPRPVQNADDTTKVRLTFKGAKLANIYMIPAMEVNGWPIADFSIVDCKTGAVGPAGASSSLFIDSPSVSQPQGGWWRGPTTDRRNAQSARELDSLKKPGTHFFLPGDATNFVVSLGAAGPTSTLRYFPRFL